MDLQEFSSALPKPWLDINANSLNVANRVTQLNGSGTPYSLWASLNSFTTASLVAVNAMGLYSGTNEIPANSIYPGHTTRIKVSGQWSTVGGDFGTISIKNDAGDVTFSQAKIYTGGPVSSEPWSAEFEIQFRSVLGLASVASTSSSIRHSIADTVAGVASTENQVQIGISTLAGISYNVYLNVGVATSSISKDLSVATVMF